MKKGYIQVYTGEGKGKTTAAMGLALRSVCAGHRVLMVQFIKGGGYSEQKAGEFLPGFVMEQYGRSCFIRREPDAQDYELAAKGLERLREAATDGEWDVVIADEINIALKYKLVSLEAVLDIVKNKSEGTELILTGRYAQPEILDAADLITEMREVRHYYTTQGVTARKGIEC